VVLEAATLTGPPTGMPRDLDDESLRRLAHSFYVVRVVRYAGLLVAALAIGALALVRQAPEWVAWSMLVLAAVFLVALALTRRRYVTSQRSPSSGPSSPSPRG
jgi:membrane protein implicated in regulation of membrane protease activity